MTMRKWTHAITAAFVVWATPASADPAFDALVEAFEAHELAFDPDATARKSGEPATTWAPVDPETLDQKAETEANMLAKLRDIDGASLSDGDAVTARVLENILAERVSRHPIDEARIPFTGDWGFQIAPVFTISAARVSREEDAVALIERINAIPAYFAENVQNMRRGMETGHTAYKDPLNTVIEQIREQSVDDPTESALYTPFKDLPPSIPPARKTRLQSDARIAITRTIQAYDDVLRFLETEYLPNTRPGAGIAELDGGKEKYAILVRAHTTRPDLTPEKVHEIGQSEVARIRGEMNDIIDELGFDGTFDEFLTFLRTNEDFYASSPEELMSAAARMSKDLDLQMPKFFRTLPRLPYGVEPVPAAIAPGYTTGRYKQGNLESGEAGIYWVNTYALDQRPLYELPALTAHEAVPGHHQQIAVAQELRDVPEFRRHYYATAFGEGWGLYSETLAGEMGLYKTPYERFGKLSYEMWRACRLVADTGLHYYGWTREEAEACFIENSALAPLNIKTEVTRYIGWPGQATAYKIGELTILSLREEAKSALGADFDIRDFHDVVLTEGAVPLGLLEERVRAWIASEAGSED